MTKIKDIKTDASLAAALGITTKTLRSWREKYGDAAPTGRDLASWKAFVEQEGLGGASNRVSRGREHWLTRSAAARARLLELEEERVRGETVKRVDVDRLHLTIASRQRTLLIQHLETELPPKLDGLPAAEMRVHLRATVDAICEVMHDMGAVIQTELARPATAPSAAQDA